MTNEELDRLEALANAATPGPRQHDVGWPIVYIDSGIQPHVYSALIDESDAAFAAAASPDVVLRLVAELRRERDFRAIVERADPQLFNAARQVRDAETDRDRLAAELTDARAEIERLATLDVFRCEEIQRLHRLQAQSDSDWVGIRAEIARLRAMVPSDAEIDAMVWFVDEHDGYGTAKKLDGYLRRIESAKENGR